MKLKHSLHFIILILLLFFSCRETNKSKFTGSDKGIGNLKYAKRFVIQKENNFTLVHLFGNRANADTTATYLLCASDSELKNLPPYDFRIKTPCKRIAALSSIYVNMLYSLSALENVMAIDNIDYINSEAIIQKHKQGQLKEVSRGPEPDLEEIIQLQPDIIFTFGMGDPNQDVQSKLRQTKIPIAVSIDHLEESPLARAEWIKFFAVFVNKEKEADSIFNVVEKNYLELKQRVLGSKNKPSVFSELKFGETWYVPGGKSFMAELIKDAGANYVWKQDPNSGSLPLSFEQVYIKAKDADYWINLSMISKKEELLKQESRYDQFKAFQNGNLFNNNNHSNRFGYSDYWETGMIYPNKILSDLILIFHPELKTQIKNDLYYYLQIK